MAREADERARAEAGSTAASSDAEVVLPIPTAETAAARLLDEFISAHDDDLSWDGSESHRFDNF